MAGVRWAVPPWHKYLPQPCIGWELPMVCDTDTDIYATEQVAGRGGTGEGQRLPLNFPHWANASQARQVASWASSCRYARAGCLGPSRATIGVRGAQTTSPSTLVECARIVSYGCTVLGFRCNQALLRARSQPRLQLASAFSILQWWGLRWGWGCPGPHAKRTR
jgi:hypothetical protein